MSEKKEATLLGDGIDALTIHQRLCGINRDLDAVGKSGVNAQQGFKFRGIDSIADAVHPLLAKWGVVCAPSLVSAKLEERVTAKGTPQVHAQLCMAWKLTGMLGDHVEISMPSEALDTSDKATNKALSAGFKYALTQLFTIPFNDVAEGDKETPELGAKKLPKTKEVSAEEAAKVVAEQQEAAGFMDVIHACKNPSDLPKIAQAIHDSALSEKYKASLRVVYAQQKEKLNNPPKKEPKFVEDLGDQDATS